MAHYNDDYSLDELQSLIESTGRKCKRAGRYLVAQCLEHDDNSPSVQVFQDGWCNCLAGCGRYHISKYFTHLRDNNVTFTPPPKKEAPVPEREYEKYDLYQDWLKMPKIPRTHTFKGLPLTVLDELGWRWTDGIAGMREGYFIPYFNASKTAINFAQVRHLGGDRRFTFLPGAKMTIYGKWNLNSPVLFLVEGTSDGAVLDYCMVPWVALPSASSVDLVRELGRFCVNRGIRLVYAGDKDKAGDSLLTALDAIAGYRLLQPPKNYKDFGEFFEAEGQLAVFEYCKPEMLLMGVVS